MSDLECMSDHLTDGVPLALRIRKGQSLKRVFKLDLHTDATRRMRIASGDQSSESSDPPRPALRPYAPPSELCDTLVTPVSGTPLSQRSQYTDLRVSGPDSGSRVCPVRG
jgi:hypothetical protein